MHQEHGFQLLGLIPFFNQLPSHIAHLVLVSLLLIVACGVASVRLKARMKTEGEGLIPEAELNFRNFFEILAEKLFGMCEMVLGESGAALYFPVIGSLFLFIFTSNLLGVIPVFLPPTDNMNVTLALGAFVFLYYNALGFREHGIHYLKHFLGPVAWLAPLMLIIEVLSHVFRPLSLALRLRGNIMGDHIVLGVFNDLAPIGIPMIFYGVGIFVSFMQAFVFVLMTMVYISLSTSHDH